MNLVSEVNTEETKVFALIDAEIAKLFPEEEKSAFEEEEEKSIHEQKAQSTETIIIDTTASSHKGAGKKSPEFELVDLE